GICQAWGLNISKGISGKAQLKDLIENHAAFPEELRESLVDMVTHAQTTQKVLNKITKTLEVLAKNDKVCQLIQTIPGLGTICSCRLRVTIGDIKRFKNPKDFPAYYGLVPRSIATGHNEKKGKITHRGDRTMRSLMVQGAGCVIRLATCGKLKSKQLTKWILKKQKEKMPWGKLVCAVAAKLLRIVRAILISSKPYNPKIAGVAKCSLSKGS
ncbi:transposase, partial [Parasutterella sp.]|uniref:transposase n=1 Tax=Parasutterella sp. TaxID=2049037 RepID=UPI00399AF0B5